MTVHMPNPMPAGLAQPRRLVFGAARLRALRNLGALALAACLPVALLLYASAPARLAALTQRDQARASCARVYDVGACGCAVDATIAAQPAPDRRDVPARRRIEASRVPIGMTPDFVRRVQACMAGLRGPAD